MRAAEKDALNVAILKAQAAGLRPFCCFGCGDWFVQIPSSKIVDGRKRGFGRRRRVCDAPECRHARLYWLRHGRWPLEPAKGRGDWGWRGPPLPAQLLFEVAA